METLESLSDALKTTKDIQSIVRTMKSLSTVSIQQYERAENALGDYEQTVELGLTALLRDRQARGLSLGPDRPQTGRQSLIVIGSDRGLCGRYNEVISRFAMDQFSDDPVLGVLGVRTAARLETAGHAAETLFTLPGSVDGLTGLVQTIIVTIDRWMREQRVTQVLVLHNRRDRNNSAAPITRQLLPIPPGYLEQRANTPWPARGVPFFRMAQPDLMSSLIQELIFIQLYRALAEALASEHATRLAAMQRAERNIQDRQTDLQSALRQKRQETITRELLDVIAGYQSTQNSD